MTPKRSYLFAAFLVAALVSCSSNERLSVVSGTVAVDGQPVESGTIHFQADVANAKAAGGGGVADGKFEVESKEGLPPGKYQIVLQAFRKTGRTFDDPQRGKVAETAPVALIDSPQIIQVSGDNADALQLRFSTSRP